MKERCGRGRSEDGRKTNADPGRVELPRRLETIDVTFPSCLCSTLLGAVPREPQSNVVATSFLATLPR